MSCAIWWIRRDLRLNDNPVLQAALEAKGTILPLFILDTHLERAQNTARFAWLVNGLKNLDAALRQSGSRLIVRQGNPLDVLVQAVQECQAEGIYAQADYSPFALQRDHQVSRCLPLHLVGGVTIHPPGAVVKADGMPYTVFTPYNRAWRSLPWSYSTLSPAPAHLNAPPALESLPLPDLPVTTHFIPSELEAYQRLECFSQDSIARYAHRRDRMDWDGTSSLSPYLRFGLLSVHQALQAAYQAAARTAEVEGRRALRPGSMS